MQNANLVNIIILNWNCWQDTVECVESCLKLTYPNFRILIVDNGSTDGSATNLRERFPRIDFIQTGSNLGFAGGNNFGIRFALDHGAEYVWLLNNDTIVSTESLSCLVNVIEKKPRVGIVGSKIYYYKENNKIWFAGGLCQSDLIGLRHKGLGEEDKGQYDEIIPVDFITGCSLLIKSVTVRNIGFMDEAFFLYWEDVDWNVRAISMGWEVLFVPQSQIWHKIGSSVKNRSNVQGYHSTRSLLIFSLKYNKKKIPLILIRSFFFSIYSFIGGEFAFGIGSLCGIRDFLIWRSVKSL